MTMTEAAVPGTEAAVPGARLFAAHLRDLTERRRAEAEGAAQRERLQGLEKLSALGTLLGGVSHELNNPLSIILAQATLLLEKAREPDMKRRAERIHGAAERCARILKSFMAMARQKPRARERVAVADLLRDALDLTAYGRRSAGIETELAVPEEGGAVACDRDLIGQALAHLLVFAQGRLVAAQGARRIAVAASRRDGFAVVEVADNGPDVPEALLPRLFEPFAATDPAGAGTGIGLHLARDAAVAHGGRLVHAHREGGGAVFRMFLPLDAAPAGALVPSGAAGRMVLVVDDERGVGQSLAELLEVLGCRCEVVEGAEEALRRLAGRRYDAVISDYRMPGMDGLTFLARAVAVEPSLRGRCVLATGDMLGAERGAAADGPGGPILLPKPFSLEDVGAALARVAWGG
jgi:nitrogen-specific signal transduction histidine kinase